MYVRLLVQLGNNSCFFTQFSSLLKVVLGCMAQGLTAMPVKPNQNFTCPWLTEPHICKTNFFAILFLLLLFPCWTCCSLVHGLYTGIHQCEMHWLTDLQIVCKMYTVGNGIINT